MAMTAEEKRQLAIEYGGVYWCEECGAYFVIPSEYRKIKVSTCPLCGGRCIWYSTDELAPTHASLKSE